MDLSSLLTAEQIVPRMAATERWGAILELVDVLVKAGKVRPEDHDVVLNALKQREETMSTGIGFGIAIPHASSDRVSEVVAAFGRSQTGIEFDSLDNAPVKFIVLFVVPRDQFQMHLRTLAAIAKLLNDRSVREALGTAATREDILAIFKSRGGGSR
jgi:mannitol/fructose-specific phosphotransferase system IIA component (Ntr-type)